MAARPLSLLRVYFSAATLLIKCGMSHFPFEMAIESGRVDQIKCRNVGVCDAARTMFMPCCSSRAWVAAGPWETKVSMWKLVLAKMNEASLNADKILSTDCKSTATTETLDFAARAMAASLEVLEVSART